MLKHEVMVADEWHDNGPQDLITVSLCIQIAIDKTQLCSLSVFFIFFTLLQIFARPIEQQSIIDCFLLPRCWMLISSKQKQRRLGVASGAVSPIADLSFKGKEVATTTDIRQTHYSFTTNEGCLETLEETKVANALHKPNVKKAQASPWEPNW